MPAYNFQERFVPMVADGSKTNTIRAKRKQRPRVGQTAHLFTGMRTKWCRRLVAPAPPITAVWDIVIGKDGEIMLNEIRLTRALADSLAWHDGFRHQQEPGKKEGCFEIMKEWWGQTHSLPFKGDFISWNKES